MASNWKLVQATRSIVFFHLTIFTFLSGKKELNKWLEGMMSTLTDDVTDDFCTGKYYIFAYIFCAILVTVCGSFSFHSEIVPVITQYKYRFYPGTNPINLL